jgi:MOSC domain-containing protein YiiM
MITRRINDSIPEDRAILRHVVRDLNQNVGVYARVLTPGTISLHDSMMFL